MPRIDLPDGKSDPEVRMWKLRPERGMGAGALSHAVYEQSIVSAAYLHAGVLQLAVEVGTYAGYSEREQLAIEYAERFALDHRNIDDEFFVRLRGAYTDAEVLDLTVCIGAWIGLGRTMSVLGIDSTCRIEP